MSELGRILDPVADRLAIAAGLLTFAISGIFPFWAALLILVRDVAVLLGGAGAALGEGHPRRREVDREDRHGVPHGRRSRGSPGATPEARFGEVLLVGGWLAFVVGHRRVLHRGRPLCDRRARRTRGPRDAGRVGTRRSIGRTASTPRQTVRERRRPSGVPGRPAVFARARVGEVGERTRPRRHHRFRTGRARRRRLRGPSRSRARRSRRVSPSARSNPRSPSRTCTPLCRGPIVERNGALEEKPELVNEQPYGDGWLVAIEPSAPADLEQLLDSGALPGARLQRLRRLAPRRLDPRPTLQPRSRVTAEVGRG